MPKDNEPQATLPVERDPEIIEALMQISHSDSIRSFVKTEGAGEDAKDIYVPGYRVQMDGSIPDQEPQPVYLYVTSKHHTHHTPHKRVEDILNPPATKAVKAAKSARAEAEKATRLDEALERVHAALGAVEQRTKALDEREARVAKREAKAAADSTPETGK